MTKDEAMRMALEALELSCTDINGNKVDLVPPAITALRTTLHQALEQPEREWGGLTDDEKWSIFTSKDWTGKPLSLIDAVLTAYEEKNRG